MTDANRQKIFQLAKSLNYFQRNFEAKQKNIAKTGQRPWNSAGGPAAEQTVEHSTTYNYSPNSDVQELTRIFQAIATTLDYRPQAGVQVSLRQARHGRRIEVPAGHAGKPLCRGIAGD